jgi:hypothetical protein
MTRAVKSFWASVQGDPVFMGARLRALVSLASGSGRSQTGGGSRAEGRGRSSR